MDSKLIPTRSANPTNTSVLTYYRNPSNTYDLEVNGTLDFTFDSYASKISYEIIHLEVYSCSRSKYRFSKLNYLN
ncbi:hypothetical protein [Algibacter sp. Ld11]|uniref:hypothetical protein n=1 Tax=Algibacter sp. Ld11 TaxID=649150 RepID=UPI003868E090